MSPPARATAPSKQRGAGPSFTANDVSPAMVAAGRAATPAGLAVDWVEADARAVPAADATFAAAVSSFGVIFVDDPEAAVAELARVLRPGGVVALAVWMPHGPLSATSLRSATPRPACARTWPRSSHGTSATLRPAI